VSTLPEPWHLYPMPPEQTAAIQRHIDTRIRQAETRIRDQIAEDIRAELAADQADSDVTSGEAIWEQGGYRKGLEAAAEIARGEQ
jgi:hypothetical protein